MTYRNDLSTRLLPNSQWFVSADLHYSGKRPAQPDNKIMLDAYHELDASIGIDSDYGQLRLWGKNLTNRKWNYFSLETNGSTFGVPAPERRFGIDYRYEF